MTTRICLICHDEFTPAMPTAKVCSNQCRFLLWNTPEGLLEELFCTYCGDVATTEDHVPPQMDWEAIAELCPDVPCFVVPACRDCNCKILGKNGLWTIAERAEFVVKALKQRLRESPGWSEVDLEELGYGLRTMIEQSIAKDAAIKQRIAYAETVVACAKAWEAALHCVFVPQRLHKTMPFRDSPSVIRKALLAKGWVPSPPIASAPAPPKAKKRGTTTPEDEAELAHMRHRQRQWLEMQPAAERASNLAMKERIKAMWET